jgi:hypothetical protein
MMDVFTNKWRIPNSLEKVYAKHIIGKGELKSKLGRIHIGTDTKAIFILNTLVLDLFDVAKLENDSPGVPAEEVPVVVSQVYDIPFDTDDFMSDLFDLSLTHNIVEVNPDNARIYLARSKNGKTNITKDIMELLAGKLTPFWKTTKMKDEGIDISAPNVI